MSKKHEDRLNRVRVAVAGLGGVAVVRAYRGSSGKYHVHAAAEDAAALDRLVELAQKVNARLSVYGNSKDGYRYVFSAGRRARKTLSAGA